MRSWQVRTLSPPRIKMDQWITRLSRYPCLIGNGKPEMAANKTGKFDGVVLVVPICSKKHQDLQVSRLHKQGEPSSRRTQTSDNPVLGTRGASRTTMAATYLGISMQLAYIISSLMVRRGLIQMICMGDDRRVDALAILQQVCLFKVQHSTWSNMQPQYNPIFECYQTSLIRTYQHIPGTPRRLHTRP